MALTLKPKHIYEPDPLQCGQAVLAMLADTTVDEIISICKNKKETTFKEMVYVLEHFGISIDGNRKQALNREDLPEIALLSLETPKCWHWSFYFKGTFYDPEYGVLSEFPPSFRRYYWKIKEDSKP
ncbi:MAG: hypothetical protein J6Q74_03465 [Clostridia bacterium]|nr:hypothetical protein [Clostridia bacterium]